MSIAARRLLRPVPKQFVAFSPGVVRPNGHYDPGVTIRDNRFIRSTWPGGAGYYVYISLNHTATLSNNVFDDDGTPVPVTTH